MQKSYCRAVLIWVGQTSAQVSFGFVQPQGTSPDKGSELRSFCALLCKKPISAPAALDPSARVSRSLFLPSTLGDHLVATANLQGFFIALF